MSIWLIIAKIVGVFLISYAIGCFSPSYFIGKIKKIDIREHGSGNAGTTNTMRVLGAKAGVIVLLLDVLKGFVATVIGYYVFRIGATGREAEFARYGVYLAGISAVVGHNWPINLGFRGGKGVATTLGIFFISEPLYAFLAFVLFLLLNYVFKLVSIASLTAMTSFCIVFLFHRLYTIELFPWEIWIFVIYLCILLGLMIYSHRSNIARLIHGKENKTDMIGIITGHSKKEEKGRNHHMYEEGLKGLVTISQALGNAPEYVQGGGGNTSAKLGDGLMAIKASGYLIKEITEEVGFVAVNYEKILDYYQNGDHTRDVDYDKESQELAVGTITQIKAEPSRRPSVEVGFHSALKKYVAHSHSVYTNCLLCAAEGKAKIESLMAETGLDYFIMPFINPGYPLSLEMTRALDARKAQGLNTDVIFLENHGLIVTSDDADRAVEINTLVNGLVKKALGLADFGVPAIAQTGEGVYESATPWLKAMLKDTDGLAEKIERMPLYPDQLVYVSGMSLEDKEAKIYIDKATGTITYRGGQSEAQAIEETLAGVAYVIKNVTDAGMTVRPMPEEGIRYILGWESEKYRRNMVNK